MGLAKTLVNIPWRHIIENAPMIVEAAKKAYKTVNKNQPGKELPGQKVEEVQSLTELMEIVEDLKTNEIRQAKLISDLAEQVKALSEGIQIISFRLNLSLVVAAALLILTLFLLVKIYFLS